MGGVSAAEINVARFVAQAELRAYEAELAMVRMSEKDEAIHYLEDAIAKCK